MSKEKFNVGTNLDDSNKIELTVKGKKDIEEQLLILINDERPKVQKSLTEARAQGDLSENAEYDAAKDKQSEIESEIAKIEDMLIRVKIVKTNKNSNKINLGSIISYKKGSNEKILQVVLVPEAEYDPLSEPIKVGANTVFAQSVMGAEVGSLVTIATDSPYKIKIVKIS